MKFSEKLKNVIFNYKGKANLSYLEELNDFLEKEELVRDIIDSSLQDNPEDKQSIEVVVTKFLTDYNLNMDLLECDTVLNTNRPYSNHISDTEMIKLNYLYIVNKILLSVYPILKKEEYCYNFDNDEIFSNTSTVLLKLSETFEDVILTKLEKGIKDMYTKLDKKSYINRYIIQCVTKYDLDSFVALLFQKNEITKSLSNLSL